MCNKCSGGNLLTGIVIGALVGAAVALLYAPQSGEETRKMLKEKAGDAKKKAEIFKKEAVKKFGQFKKTAIDEIDDVKFRASRAAREFKKKRAS